MNTLMTKILEQILFLLCMVTCSNKTTRLRHHRSKPVLHKSSSHEI